MGATLLTDNSKDGVYEWLTVHEKSKPLLAFASIKASTSDWHHRPDHPFAKVLIMKAISFLFLHHRSLAPLLFNFFILMYGALLWNPSMVVMKDPEDIAAYRKSIERQRVHIFLAGLDGDFEQVRGEILRKDPLPDLEECYALIRRETERHASMKVEFDNPDTSTMDIQTRETIGCGIKRGKLYYLDLQSNDSNKLRQALMADGSEREKKKMTWLCLMKTKDEVNLLFQKFHKMIETQYNAKTTCSNTHQQNGVAERKNRHLLEVVRASLIAAKPISYWESNHICAYLINRGEYQKEIQTLDYDYHISEEDESDNLN
ncbi:hypothetical protein CK203_052530 [Vitis vinifera]|uniref:Integrase catalytic domain-containing protein n=1 Tax=Vitis vinifera TaxID=29760 RepID=A0A438GIB3_VITVI|nr:hypothetical protein CK203_052530 [Vitis vinifera]